MFHVPDIAVNLLSVSRITQQGHSVKFTKTGCQIVSSDGEIIATGSNKNGIFKLDRTSEKSYCTKVSSNGELWHQRLGHLNRKSMRILQKDLVIGYDLLTKPLFKMKHSYLLKNMGLVNDDYKFMGGC
ncbi:hypothetical protein JTB14_034379 [Gonioctena quinquepunctata]|nr:hypothetical protein JTB14_034379 [Gonioctena quinquepunctata]